ncbi:plasmid stabilization protein [Nocardioides sp. DS6]|uniref:Plasmid stabilization protein n=1 Tax=Nocardioides eburneus TaxID=3231482 RepID=A0ABV3T1J8_9ACTN
MAMMTVRNLSPEVQAKLKRRAAAHGRSMEAEARSILEAAVTEDEEPFDLLGSFLSLGAEIGLTDDEAAELITDRTASMPRAIDL